MNYERYTPRRELKARIADKSQISLTIRDTILMSEADCVRVLEGFGYRSLASCQAVLDSVLCSDALNDLCREAIDVHGFTRCEIWSKGSECALLIGTADGESGITTVERSYQA